MRVNMNPNTYLYLAFLLLMLPAKFLLAWLLAMAAHEFSHCFGVKLCGGKVLGLCIGVGGIHMQSTPMSDIKRLFCVLCGPIGGFLLTLLGRWLPLTALLSWLLSAYNLLPFPFLDGGKALEILVGDAADKVAKAVMLLLLLAAIYGTVFMEIGALPMVIITGLWLKYRKTPCKPGVCKLQ